MMLQPTPIPTSEDLRRVGRGQVSGSVRERIERASMLRLPDRAAPRRAWFLAAAGASLVGGLAIGLIAAPLTPNPEPSAQSAEVLPPGTEVAAIDVPRALSVGRHRAEVQAHSTLRVVRNEAGRIEVRLLEGTSQFAVEHLRPEESFQVQTSRVLVQVVGTRFQVTSLPSCTVVAVEEGKVQVTDAEGRSDAVASGERRTFCAPPAKIAMDDEPGTEQIREALVLVSSGKDLERAARMLAEYREQHPDGVFAEEALFHLCVIDLRLSRVQQAAELSEAFARRFPNSPRARTLADLVRRAREASPSTDLR